MKKKCMDKGSKERSPPHNLGRNRVNTYAVRITMLIADIEDDIMDPVMQCTTLPSHSSFSQKKLVSFVTEIHTTSIDFLTLKHPSDTYVLTMKMEILLEPASNKLLVEDSKLSDSLFIVLFCFDTFGNENNESMYEHVTMVKKQASQGSKDDQGRKDKVLRNLREQDKVKRQLTKAKEHFSNPTNNLLQIQDVHMFKRESLRVTMLRMMLGTHRGLFELHLQDLLQKFNATIVVRKDEARVTLIDEQNDFLVVDASRMEEIEELSANICLMAIIQPANIDSDACYVNLSTIYVNPLFTKDNQEQKYLKQPKIINDTFGDDQIDRNIIFDEPNVDDNSGSVEYDNNVQESYELEQLARNAYKETEKQQIIAKKVD
ncbi:hypothetical protein Tco_0891204 [Tanacetum coccineum]|uniref:Uncharacterized protein n=1 Tax=Tanacetum coccineum TaxID=301880 RepID=A0ABQ5C5G8_9ASTR